MVPHQDFLRYHSVLRPYKNCNHAWLAILEKRRTGIGFQTIPFCQYIWQGSELSQRQFKDYTASGEFAPTISSCPALPANWA